MPVFNGARYLREAIESILNQTFDDFEFLIIDDGSTDMSREIISSYTDSRIILRTNTVNKGIVEVLNEGLLHAKGMYIARMDCDDISLPHRLERLVSFMDKHNEIGIAGSSLRLIKNGKLKNTKLLPETNEELKITLLFNTCFFHPTVIIRKAIINNNCYPGNRAHAEDYNFWTIMAPKTEFANLKETLLYSREHSEQISQQNALVQKRNASLIRKTYFLSIFDSINEQEFEIHQQIAANDIGIDIEKAMVWLEYLIRINQQKNTFSPQIFNSYMSNKWWNCCRKNTQYGKDIIKKYKSFKFLSCYKPSPYKYFKFLLKCYLR